MPVAVRRATGPARGRAASPSACRAAPPPPSLAVLRAENPGLRCGENAPQRAREEAEPAEATVGGLSLPYYYLAATSRARGETTPRPRRRPASPRPLTDGQRNALPRRGMDSLSPGQVFGELPLGLRRAFRAGPTHWDPTGSRSITGLFSVHDHASPQPSQRPRRSRSASSGVVPRGEIRPPPKDGPRSPRPRSSRGASPAAVQRRPFSVYTADSARRLVPGFGQTDRRGRPVAYEAVSAEHAERPSGMVSGHSDMFRRQTVEQRPLRGNMPQPKPRRRTAHSMGTYSLSPRRRYMPELRSNDGRARVASASVASSRRGPPPPPPPAEWDSTAYPLLCAVKADNPDAVRALLRNGDEAELRLPGGQTVHELHCCYKDSGMGDAAAREGILSAFAEWEEGREARDRILVDRLGVDMWKNGLLLVLPRAAWDTLTEMLPTRDLARFHVASRGTRFLSAAALRDRLLGDGDPAGPSVRATDVAAAPPTAEEVEEWKVEELVKKGASREEAVSALERTGGCLEAAVAVTVG